MKGTGGDETAKKLILQLPALQSTFQLITLVFSTPTALLLCFTLNSDAACFHQKSSSEPTVHCLLSTA